MKRKKNKSGIGIFALLLIPLCWAQIPLLPPPAKASNPPQTLAVLPFENNSVTDPARYAPLSKGISAMLMTDLKNRQAAIRIIERGKIQALLKESAFNQLGGVDESTAIQAGKMLGAESIAFGSFIVLGDQVRIDTRIIGSETSEVIMADAIMGDTGDFMELVNQLGQKIASSLNTSLQPAETASGSNIQAAVHFSQGIEALDRNDAAAAEQHFSRSVRLDPSYRSRVKNALAEMPKASNTGAAASAASTASAPLPAGDIKTVEAEGISFQSREDAIRQAQRSAVEQAVGVFVQSQTEVQNFEVQKEKIFSRSRGYITRYQVLKELETGGQFIIRIKADVSLSKVKDDLLAMKILLDSMERPKMMVMIEEQSIRMPSLGMDFAQTEMSSYLQSKGFELVDQQQVERVKQIAQGRQALAGNLDAAKQLGLDMGAEYVVVGKAVAENAGEAYPGSGIQSIQAGIQLKVIQSRTGLLLGSTVKNGVAAHPSVLTGASQALRKTVQKACDEYLIDAVTESFQDFLNNGAPVLLHVSGVTSFAKYKQMAAFVGELEKTVSSRKQGWNKTGGLLILDLRFRGTSEELAEMIDGRSVNGGNLEVVDFAPDRVDCKIK